MPMSEYMRKIRSKVGHQLLEIPGVSVAIRDEQGRVLLVRHENDNAWVTPGGAVEPTEVPADAAAREVWEETGLLVELVRILGVYGGPEFIVNYRNGDQVSFLTVVFEGKPIAGVPRPDGIETLEIRYFTREEVQTVKTPQWLGEILADVFANRSHTAFRPSGWSPPQPTQRGR